MTTLPLQGIRILDLSRIWAGPYATKLLADMGAEVIKVESPRFYDPFRGVLNPGQGVANYPGGDPGEHPWNRAGWFNALHMSQYSLVLDLAHPRGREVFERLVAVSDVLIENFRYGAMERLGYGYPVLRSLRPDIIYCSMPAFGNSGPWRDYIQYGIGQEHLAGMASMTGYPGQGPMKSGINHGDPITGSHAAGALLAALLYRRRTGKGMFIDISHYESAVALIGEHILSLQVTGRNPGPRGNRHPCMAPHGVFPCRGDDRWVSIAVGSDAEFRALCASMGNPELAQDPRFADSLSRLEHQEELEGIIAAWTRGQTASQVAERLQRAGVPAMPVMDARDLLEDPQHRARETFVEITHPEAGTHLYPGLPWKLSRTPGAVRWPAPCFGEHNALILGDLLGLDGAQQRALEQEGIVSQRPLGEGESG
ncbi:MAG: CoA transferase [Chloroflexi bacterium]|nr:CoA transferase [Chloroflexota bacterium]